ncbi:3-deoxy-D-manno-octulosonate 8-phosphate phosphatase KdsC [Pseudidiomarina piscicola]|uniref:3-deoxy-D-manno-octulosonate 8-phosphate phosphatase KdsC n=1 Tax=Pseudidiomarina piscicola TaxID=2614830 RepID=A0A6S6WMH3_9GAMM|nr:3-deoxy-manno-octulosonate-8-phosphatase KdsC [Pseudidiomarina piscicola]CAB0150540.1 3-deoxy-D-manno-octulosonate 8-phosphate phosphatase KdsC [Pseudidiomarina piscicola]VZT40035.1 3-deoxy-D-manno-octulosonate 8-phosphate phosphatase KdsC [Pseudomonas aeruginosa]
MSTATTSTWYGEVSTSLLTRMKSIKLLICDVDGVFSDGRIYLGNHGEELKAFNTRDGFGVKALLNNGIQVAVITGRTSHIVEQRMQALGVQDIHQGTLEKGAVYQQLAAKYQLNDAQIASIGDDVPDVALLNQASVGVAPHDAHPWVQQQADYVTSLGGGCGAVRELSDLILLSQGKLQLQGGVSL